MEHELEKKYADYPACCRKVLIELELDGRTGARNCAKGHLCRAIPLPPRQPAEDRRLAKP